MRKAISAESRQAVANLVGQYRAANDRIHELDADLTEVQALMESLRQAQSDALHSLAEAREAEAVLMDQLAREYGPGRLDVNSWEWVVKEEIKDVPVRQEDN